MATHYRTCPLCEATCGLTIETDGDRVTAVKGDKDNPFSSGYICPKGRALGELHHHEARLVSPMIKVGGNLRPCSYEEAYARIGAEFTRLKNEFGSGSLAAYLGNPSVHNPSLFLYTPQLIRALRTTHIYSASSVDQMPKQMASGMMYGTAQTVAVPDIDRCDLLVIVGANPMVSNGSLWTVPNITGRFKAMRERGGRIVVVDPKKTRTASQADAHHFIKPGTDVHLLWGLVHSLLIDGPVTDGANLHTAQNIDDLENSLDKLRRQAAQFELAALATHCGINVGTIKQLALDLFSTERAALYGRMGTCTQAFGAQASWLVDVVGLLTNNVDKPGTMMFPTPAGGSANTQSGRGRGFNIGKKTSRVRNLPQRMGEFPSATLADEILTPGDGQIKALVTIAGNPAVSLPGSDRMRQALESLEFMVSVDIYINETTQHADVILPGLSPLEDSHFDFIFAGFSTRNFIQYSPAVFAKPENQEYEWESMLKLCHLISKGTLPEDLAAEDNAVFHMWTKIQPGSGRSIAELIAHYPEPGPERVFDYLLRVGPYGSGFNGDAANGLNLDRLRSEVHGVDLGPLEPRLPEVLKTKSGKIELCPDIFLADAKRAEQALQAGLPDLMLIGRRHIKSNNSWMHNIDKLVEGKGRTALQIHPQSAQGAGIQQGDRVDIESSAGRLEGVAVDITEDIMPGVVSLPHGWSEMTGVAGKSSPNVNVLNDAQLVDPISGNAAFSGVPVRITVSSAQKVAQPR